MEWWTVDRLEGEQAVCENEVGQQLLLPLSRLPDGVSEGDVLRRQGEEWSVDEEETAVRRERAAARTRALFRRRSDPSKGAENFQPK